MLKLFIAVLTYFMAPAAKYSLDDKPPEHTKEFYINKTIPEIKRHMELDIKYMEPILKATIQEYQAHGLTVPATFYIDSEQLVRKEWSTVVSLLDNASSESNLKTNYAMMGVECYGFRHLVDRVKELREARPILPTSDDVPELQERLLEIQTNTTAGLDLSISKGKEHNNDFLVKFHEGLKAWLVPEFAKLNDQINAITDVKLKVNNMKVLFEDLQLMQQPPF